jgi:hypothetical protein
MHLVTRNVAVALGATALLSGLLVGAVPASALLIVPVAPIKEGAPNRICAWPINYPADANYSWPDTDAAYFVQSAFIEKGDELVFTGRDPKARYWSIQTYSFRDREVIDSVNDSQVKREGKGRKAQWTVRVTTSKSAPGDNVLQGALPFTPPIGRLPSKEEDGHQLTVVIYRVYRSATGEPAGGPLPMVEVRGKDGRRDVLAPCKASQIGPPEDRIELPAQQDVPGAFTRAPGGSFYPSFDTSYLVAERAYDPSKVLVVRGKSPRTPRDVRYWSLCQNINESPLPVVDCVSDSNIKVTKGRYTIAVVTDKQVAPRDRVKYKGVTFIDWGAVAADGSYRSALLLFRHILPNPKFAYSVAQVDEYQLASTTMGDYAPIIEQVPLSELRPR